MAPSWALLVLLSQARIVILGASILLECWSSLLLDILIFVLLSLVCSRCCDMFRKDLELLVWADPSRLMFNVSRYISSNLAKSRL